MSAPRQVHLFKHVMKYHWVWCLSLEWDGEVPPARYRDWRRSKFFKQSTGGGQFSSDSEDNLCDTWMHCDPNTCAGTVHRVSGALQRHVICVMLTQISSEYIVSETIIVIIMLYSTM